MSTTASGTTVKETSSEKSAMEAGVPPIETAGVEISSVRTAEENAKEKRKNDTGGRVPASSATEDTTGMSKHQAAMKAAGESTETASGANKDTPRGTEQLAEPVDTDGKETGAVDRESAAFSEKATDPLEDNNERPPAVAPEKSTEPLEDTNEQLVEPVDTEEADTPAPVRAASEKPTEPAEDDTEKDDIDIETEEKSRGIEKPVEPSGTKENDTRTDEMIGTEEKDTATEEVTTEEATNEDVMGTQEKDSPIEEATTADGTNKERTNEEKVATGDGTTGEETTDEAATGDAATNKMVTNKGSERDDAAEDSATDKKPLFDDDTSEDETKKVSTNKATLDDAGKAESGASETAAASSSCAEKPAQRVNEQAVIQHKSETKVHKKRKKQLAAKTVSLNATAKPLTAAGPGPGPSPSRGRWGELADKTLLKKASSAAKKKSTKAKSPTPKKKRKAESPAATPGTGGSSSRKRAKKSPGTGSRSPAAVVWEGSPDDPLEGGWPPGWKKEKRLRQTGKFKGKADAYWITPVKKYKLRSLVEVRNFMSSLKETNDEEEAKRAIRRKA